MSDYLRVKEVAELLSISEQTVRKLIKSNELRSIKVGTRNVRVERKAVEEFTQRKGDKNV